MKKLFIFPDVFMANIFAMILIMIGLSLFGRPELAWDFGIVYAATVALFYSFSGNARSIFLAGNRQVDSAYILRSRCFIVLPLCVLNFVLLVFLNRAFDLLSTRTALVRRGARVQAKGKVGHAVVPALITILICDMNVRL
ncbi:hypothetical protein [Pseudomonas sp. PD9R]|uniref:hypothetical protein n=1 Tax=Pseudomonas sp. PD9R TaxID=2853534 RepID=UPI001C4817A3|nr:hypothetical protein [Pseudomonas sp. PD9R]MBV6824261.1 hypothetical protein [Pseudomonas sp. PD9R]